MTALRLAAKMPKGTKRRHLRRRLGKQRPLSSSSNREIANLGHQAPAIAAQSPRLIAPRPENDIAAFARNQQPRFRAAARVLPRRKNARFEHLAKAAEARHLGRNNQRSRSPSSEAGPARKNGGKTKAHSVRTCRGPGRHAPLSRHSGDAAPTLISRNLTRPSRVSVAAWHPRPPKAPAWPRRAAAGRLLAKVLTVIA